MAENEAIDIGALLKDRFMECPACWNGTMQRWSVRGDWEKIGLFIRERVTIGTQWGEVILECVERFGMGDHERDQVQKVYDREQAQLKVDARHHPVVSAERLDKLRAMKGMTLDDGAPEAERLIGASAEPVIERAASLVAGGLDAGRGGKKRKGGESEYVEAIRWVAACIRLPGLKREDAPSQTAWNLREWAQRNPQNEGVFFKDLFPRLLPNNKAIEMMERFRDDGRVLRVLEETLGKMNEEELYGEEKGGEKEGD